MTRAMIPCEAIRLAKPSPEAGECGGHFLQTGVNSRCLGGSAFIPPKRGRSEDPAQDPERHRTHFDDYVMVDDIVLCNFVQTAQFSAG